MKKQIIIPISILIAIAAFVATAAILTREPASGTISQTNDGQGGTTAGEGEASGSNEGSGASAARDDSTAAAGEASSQTDSPTEIKGLNIYSYDNVLAGLVRYYAERHPEFKYKINLFDYPLIDNYCTLSQINENIQSDSKEVVDIYCVPDGYTHEFIKGEYSRHACTYKELGIDIDAALKKADIPQHIIDAGTNPDGEVIALPYMTEVNVFMYRRSIARDVWGTDDPDKIAGIIGSGTNKWDRFLKAAQTLKEHGCYIAPGFWDVSNMIDTGLSASAFNSDEDSEINPKWQEFMDISKKMQDKGYIQKKSDNYWTEEWINAMNGKGDKPVFGIVIPFEYVSYVLKSDNLLRSTAGDWAICVPPINTSVGFFTGIMVNKHSPNKDALGPLIKWLTLDCSKTGLQYVLANDELIDEYSQQYEVFGGKQAVISGSMLRGTECSIDVLGGQNINPVIYDALNAPTGRHDYYGIEMSIFQLWLEETRAYLAGEKDREAAVADFKKAEKRTIDWHKDMLKQYGISFLLP